MRWWRARAVLNLLNASTPAGLALAVTTRCRLRRLPRGMVLASGYPFGFPRAAAFTVGDVVLTRSSAERILARPALLAHEERHSWQYAACLGLPFLPLYLLGAGWSWLTSGHVAVRNPFEQLAGLADGGYPTVSARPALLRAWRRRR